MENVEGKEVWKEKDEYQSATLEFILNFLDLDGNNLGVLLVLAPDYIFAHYFTLKAAS